jgi:hypothetical protein
LTAAADTVLQSAVLFLVAVILQFIRSLWSVIYDAAWILQYNEIPEAVPNVVDPILNEWALFVVLVLVFVVGRRQLGGLWSTPQPWNQGLAPGAVLPQQQGGQWQKQQPPQMGGYQQPAHTEQSTGGWQHQGGYAPQQYQGQQMPQQEWRSSQMQTQESRAPGSDAHGCTSPPPREVPHMDGTTYVWENK